MKKDSDFKMLARYAGERRILVVLSVVLAVMSAAAAVSPFIFLHRIIFQILGYNERSTPEADVVLYGVITCLAVFVFILSRSVSLVCACSVGVRISGEIRRQLTEHIGRLPEIYTEQFGPERLRGLIIESSETAEKYFSRTLPDMAFAVSLPLALACVMLIFDLKFGLVCMAPLTAGVIVAVITAKKPITRNVLRHRKLFTVMVLCGVSLFAFIIIAAVILSQTSGTSVEQLLNLTSNVVFFGILTPSIYAAVMKLADTKAACRALSASARSIEIIKSAKPEPEPAGDKIPEDFSVLFTHVTCMDPEQDQKIIQDMSVRIIDKDKAAFVGSNLSGREAVPALISGRLSASEGSVMIGNVDVKELSRKVLSNNITYISDSVKLMNASVLDNVRMARLNAGRYEIIDALHTAGCDDFIHRLANGVDTVLDTKSIFLMQPDKLKLELARAYIKNAPVVILDNVVKGLSPEDEDIITRFLDEFCKDRTVIMLPHKLPSARSANRIYVMEGGRLLEYGRHDILMRMNSAYCKLWAEYNEQYDFSSDRNRWKID